MWYVLRMIKRYFPWLALTLGVLWVGGSVAPPKADPGGADLVRSGKIPVLVGGRIKPLDTAARNSLLILQGRERVSSPEISQPFVSSPIEWLLDVLLPTGKSRYLSDLCDRQHGTPLVTRQKRRRPRHQLHLDAEENPCGLRLPSQPSATLRFPRCRSVPETDRRAGRAGGQARVGPALRLPDGGPEPTERAHSLPAVEEQPAARRRARFLERDCDLRRGDSARRRSRGPSPEKASLSTRRRSRLWPRLPNATTTSRTWPTC